MKAEDGAWFVLAIALLLLLLQFLLSSHFHKTVTCDVTLPTSPKILLTDVPMFACIPRLCLSVRRTTILCSSPATFGGAMPAGGMATPGEFGTVSVSLQGLAPVALSQAHSLFASLQGFVVHRVALSLSRRLLFATCHSSSYGWVLVVTLSSRNSGADVAVCSHLQPPKDADLGKAVVLLAGGSVSAVCKRALGFAEAGNTAVACSIIEVRTPVLPSDTPCAV